MPHARRIDVHAHFVPDFYRQAAESAGFGKPDGMPGIPKWSVENALATMDRNDIETAILSISAPGIHFGNVQATIDLARRVNEYAADVIVKHPGRFGFFAILPLPDVEAALHEVAFALTALNADGFVITSNQDGIYPGDPRYEPLFAELGQRRATLFIHPTSPSSCASEGGTDLQYPRPIIEFMFETTRVVTNLILTGTTRRHAGFQLIIPHGGAALSVLADRIAGVLGMLPKTSQLQPDEVLSELRRISYDVAGFALPRLLPALLELTDHAHLLYGSDWPHSPEPVVTKLIADLASSKLFTPSQLRSLARQCAVSVSQAIHLAKRLLTSDRTHLRSMRDVRF